MASETPKKVMDEISKCFLCSSPLTDDELLQSSFDNITVDPPPQGKKTNV